MRALLAACAIAAANVFVLAMSACSSSSPPPAADPVDASTATVAPDPSTGDSGSPPPEMPTPQADSGTTANNPSDGSVAATDAGPPDDDAGPIVILDGGPGQEGGVPCVAGGAVESEPNDTAAAANTLATGTTCGVITPGTESDFFTYTLAAAINNVNVKYKGNITITFTVNGQTVTWGNGSFPAVPFVRAMPYVLEVKSADGNLQDYQITLTES